MQAVLSILFTWRARVIPLNEIERNLSLKIDEIPFSSNCGENKNKSELLFSDQTKKITFEVAPKITFTQIGKKGLFVTIETENLLIRSVLPQDLDECIRLWGDEKVMATFGNGEPIVDIPERMPNWLRRWNNGNPFSPLSIFEKDTNKFLGNALLTSGEKGEVELGAVLNVFSWKLGVATKVGTAIVEYYVPQLIQKEYKSGDEIIKSIFATARKDNHASNKLLEKWGMEKDKDVEKHGATRNFYRKDLSKPQNSSKPQLRSKL